MLQIRLAPFEIVLMISLTFPALLVGNVSRLTGHLTHMPKARIAAMRDRLQKQ